MMELLWTPEAIQDRDEIYDFIEADNPVAALALDELSWARVRRCPSRQNASAIHTFSDLMTGMWLQSKPVTGRASNTP